MKNTAIKPNPIILAPPPFPAEPQSLLHRSDLQLQYCNSCKIEYQSNILKRSFPTSPPSLTVSHLKSLLLFPQDLNITPSPDNK